MLFKLSNLNSNLAQTLGYLNPALNNSALIIGQRSLQILAETVENLPETSVPYSLKFSFGKYSLGRFSGIMR